MARQFGPEEVERLRAETASVFRQFAAAAEGFRFAQSEWRRLWVEDTDHGDWLMACGLRPPGARRGKAPGGS